MSIKLMSVIWEDESLPTTDKMVMLSLADHANDDGLCYPSIKRVMKRTSLKERTVQTAIKRLRGRGYLTVKMNAGQGGANLYTIHATPAADAPRSRCTPAADCTPPPQETAQTPAADAPKPSVTINEPSVTDNAREVAPKKMRLPEDWVPDDEDWAYAISKNLTDDETKEIADDFHAYWTDRTDKGGRKSERGWKQAWRNRVRDQAPRFIRNRGLAVSAFPPRNRQGSSVASIVARRHSGG